MSLVYFESIIGRRKMVHAVFHHDGTKNVGSDLAHFLKKNKGHILSLATLYTLQNRDKEDVRMLSNTTEPFDGIIQTFTVAAYPRGHRVHMVTGKTAVEMSVTEFTEMAVNY